MRFPRECGFESHPGYKFRGVEEKVSRLAHNQEAENARKNGSRPASARNWRVNKMSGKTYKPCCEECSNAYWYRRENEDAYYKDEEYIYFIQGCMIPKEQRFSKGSKLISPTCKDFKKTCVKCNIEGH